MRWLLILLVWGSSAVACPVAAQIGRPSESWRELMWDEIGENCGNLDGSRPVAESRITVLASGQWSRLDLTGQPISVATRAEIEAVQGADFVRLVERLPGVTVTRNGGPGAFTGLRVRGSETEQVLVLVDGVRLGDPASPGAGFDSGMLTLGSLERVELQRSANSTVWGSQALGGVLAVESLPPAASYPAYRPGLQLDHARLNAEYGAFTSRIANASVGASLGPLALALGGGWRASDGFSAAAAGSEPDGQRQWDLAARARVRLDNGVSLFASGRLAQARVDLDGYPAPLYALADTAEYQDQRQQSGQAGVALESDAVDLQAAVSASNSERDLFDPAFGPAAQFTSRGTSRRAELRGRVQPEEEWQVRFGAEHEWLTYATLFDPGARTATSAAFAQAEYNRYDRSIHVAVGLRREDHRQFGGAWSLGADGAWQVSDGWRLTASYGQGFKAPSLFQLLSDYGNARLQPEQSRSYDAGLAWASDEVDLALTLFRRETRDQIVFVSCYGSTATLCAARPNGTYDNRARTRASGLEAEARVQPLAALELRGIYSLIATADRTPGSASRGNSLARRPRHTATLTAAWSLAEKMSLAADLRLASRAWDDAANRVPLPGYGVATVRGNWDLSPVVQLYARIENLTDSHYQTAAGFAQPGRSAWLGARVRL